jgi:hypothetical protein
MSGTANAARYGWTNFGDVRFGHGPAVPATVPTDSGPGFSRTRDRETR